MQYKDIGERGAPGNWGSRRQRNSSNSADYLYLNMGKQSITRYWPIANFVSLEHACIGILVNSEGCLHLVMEKRSIIVSGYLSTSGVSWKTR